MNALAMIERCVQHQDGVAENREVNWSVDDALYLCERIKTQETLPDPEVTT